MMEIMKDLVESMTQALETQDAEEFYRLSSVLQNRKSAAREKIQEMTSKEVKGIVEKLAKGEKLTEHEMDLVKLWIVGDAESYSEMENNFEDWIEEFKRLISVLKEHESGTEEMQGLFRLQGILEDARRVAHDLGAYLETKERIRRFEQATADPSLLDRNLIVQILKLKLTSPDS